MIRSTRFVAPIALATVLGPFAAGAMFCPFALITAVSDGFDGSGSLIDLFKMFALYMMFAYLEGAKIAFVGGLLLAFWMTRWPPSLLAANGAALASVLLDCAAAGLGMLNEIDAGAVRNNFVLYLFIAAFAATVCWGATCRWVTRL